jgi:DNA-binding NtrC family response regulator
MKRARILVVDDKPNVCEIVATVLEKYDVATASNGSEALALIASESFDVIVTDVCMPGANGHEVLVAAKARSAHTQVVLMTGFATVADAVSAMKQGACEYIEKPFHPDDILLAVAQALQPCTIGAAGAPPVVAEVAGSRGQVGATTSLPYRKAIDAARAAASRNYLGALMREFGGNVTRAAERAGMDRENLHRLLRRFGLHSSDFRHPGQVSQAADRVP